MLKQIHIFSVKIEIYSLIEAYYFNKIEIQFISNINYLMEKYTLLTETGKLFMTKDQKFIVLPN